MRPEIRGVDIFEGTLLGANGGTDRADDVRLGHCASNVGRVPSRKPSEIRLAVSEYNAPDGQASGTVALLTRRPVRGTSPPRTAALSEGCRTPVGAPPPSALPNRDHNTVA
ncbi:hypothetical protein Acsp03_34170 [Actinomadura sp. NBRC 104412]|nr:hypothetical protein Acsp03_34170 [Actinomadura sp. NBRC 104412]